MNKFSIHKTKVDGFRIRSRTNSPHRSERKRLLQFMLIRYKCMDCCQASFQIINFRHIYKKRCIFILIAISVYSFFVINRYHHQDKFVTFTLNHSTFSDQLFEICVGTILAKAVGRRFHILDGLRPKQTRSQLKLIARMFPSLRKQMSYIKNSTSVTFVQYDYYTKRNLKRFCDSQRGGLVFDFQYAFDISMLEQNEGVLRRMLEFSDSIQPNQQQMLQKYNITTKHSAICVHIDGKVQLLKDDEIVNTHNIVVASREIAMKMNLTQFYVFIDDKSFSRAITDLLSSYNNWQPNVHISQWTQAMELYMVKQICGAVLLTSMQSIHGFLIGIFAAPNVVYYLASKKSNGTQLYL
ncbi:hypothetical protein DICVIV_05278 [Dictyocaulus viviparus]|uniref:Uncharacterized protein n=1 Tax=Dictyocaulus viviparus TaxID=29172 RepID=A0A0D8Y1W9_DICVI|nr:hypothetical protein DICVIV_05278 [Dictyocaulus viviparus]